MEERCRRMVFLALLLLWNLFQTGLSLRCYVGLGNTSKRDEQKVVACPDDKDYACVKMFGGGMGDHIRRKCEKLDTLAFEQLMEQEAEKERLISTGEGFDQDPACEDTTNHGRKVTVCYCSSDQCNKSNNTSSNKFIIVAIVTALWSFCS